MHIYVKNKWHDSPSRDSLADKFMPKHDLSNQEQKTAPRQFPAKTSCEKSFSIMIFSLRFTYSQCVLVQFKFFADNSM